MKIFGVGLSKTGTYSLHCACQVLGFSSQHWAYTRRTIQYGHNGVEIDFSKFEPFDAFFDTPVARIYKELDAKFPGSKFILTERDTDDWLRSYKIFFEPNSPSNSKTPNLITDLYGTTGHEDEILRKSYEAHNDQVKQYFRYRPNDLLCMTIGKGNEWARLCSFLSVPIPDVPFIRSNTKTENKWVRTYYKHRSLINTFVPKFFQKIVADVAWPEWRKFRSRQNGQ